MAASFRLDVGRADHLAPFLGFVGNQLAKVGPPDAMLTLPGLPLA
jgi:hypothetical protein